MLPMILAPFLSRYRASLRGRATAMTAAVTTMIAMRKIFFIHPDFRLPEV